MMQQTISNPHNFEESESLLQAIQKLSKDIYTYESLVSTFSVKVAELKARKEMLVMTYQEELDYIIQFSYSKIE